MGALHELQKVKRVARRASNRVARKVQNAFDARAADTHTRRTMRTELAPELHAAAGLGLVSILVILPL